MSNPFHSANLLSSGGGGGGAGGGGIRRYEGATSAVSTDSNLLKKKMSKLNENFLLFMEKNPGGNWRDGLQVKSSKIILSQNCNSIPARLISYFIIRITLSTLQISL